MLPVASILFFLLYCHQNALGQDFVPNGFEEVPSSSLASIGHIDKCGEGDTAGKKLCVPYYSCDGDTNLIVQDGVTDGFGVIDIRFGVNDCDHPMDVCCGIPPGASGEIINKNPTPQPPPPIHEDENSGDTESWTCGVHNNNGIDFKISGNNDNEAEYGEFPWMVAIMRKYYDPKTENLLVCGGSLIGPNIVLTGAHCVVKFKTDELRIRAGEWDTQTNKERLPYQERDVSRIVIHENFHPTVLYNDVALLLLSSPLREAKHIGTICLPGQGMITNSRECFASGWGKEFFGAEKQFQVILKKIELPIIENRECEELLRKTRLGKRFMLDQSFTCAGGERGKDTCTGDGGGPLVCPDPSGRYYQAGIVSWGIGCGDEQIPGVYADVAKFRSWIDDQLQRLPQLKYL